eukprot:evm.model.scf_487.3 EVM.evm.TU.scf_487.3   scf_487:49055-50245(+)
MLLPELVRYDGTGPDVFWYAADTRENLEKGFVMDGIPKEHGPWNGSEEVIIKLPDGATWDDANAISVWCRAFGIDFGSVVFGESEEEKAAAKMAAMDLHYEGKDNMTTGSEEGMEGKGKKKGKKGKKGKKNRKGRKNKEGEGEVQEEEAESP